MLGVGHQTGGGTEPTRAGHHLRQDCQNQLPRLGIGIEGLAGIYRARSRERARPDRQGVEGESCLYDPSEKLIIQDLPLYFGAINDHSNATFRSAQASGRVSDGFENFTPNPSGFASIFTEREGRSE